MTLKGTYSGLTSYDIGDVVGFQDNYYLKWKACSSGIIPTDTAYWEKLPKWLAIAAKFAQDGKDTALDGKVFNGLSQTSAGKVLDARQGKALKDMILDISPDAKTLVLESSTASSDKKFAIRVEDDGELTATEITGGET